MSTRNGIKNHFEQYLTGEYGSECLDVTPEFERLPEDYQAFLDADRPKYVQKGGIDVAAFRAWCEAVDEDQDWIEKTERELF